MGISAVRQIEYEHGRFAAEERFSRWLLSRDAQLAKRFGAPLDAASARVAAAFDAGDLAAIRRAARGAEQELAGLAEAAKRYTVYCAGHAHIDMNWMWSWPETVSVTIDSVTTVLRLLDEFPSFVFSQSQASIYRILETYRPDLLEAVKRHVAEGRWEVTASHWVETDKNMVSGESLARHLLYTRAYMNELFGLEPEDVPIDWAPDTFGHAHTVPDYLVRGGVRFTYLHRPGSDGGPEKPGLFRWRGSGGGEVIAHNDMYHGYNGVIGPHIATDVLAPRVEETGLPFALFVYGVGDHGGGPTRADIARVLDMVSWPLFPEIRFSTVRAYFERVEAETARDAASLPVVEGELNYEFTGCYTTETLIKRANRYGEQRLLAAELACSIASRLANVPYPHQALTARWQDHLFSHFHDILPGSGVHDTRTYTHGLYQGIVAAAGAAETQALRAIAALVDTRGADVAGSDGGAGTVEPRTMGAGAGRGTADGGVSHYTYERSDRSQAVIVFNHQEVDRREVIEVVLWDQGSSWGGGALGFRAEAPDGSIAEAQLLETGGYWGHEYRRVAFQATVPAFGYARYIVRPVPTEAGSPAAPHSRRRSRAGSMHVGLSSVCTYASHERSPEGLANEHVRLDLDPTTGGIRRFVRLADGAVLIDRNEAAAVLHFAVERPRPMSAWQVNHAMHAEQPVLVKLHRSEDGPYAASIACTYRIRSSEMTVTYRLLADDPVVRVSIAGRWFERGGPEIGTPVLSLRLPTTLVDGDAWYETPFGAIRRSTAHGEEVPALGWAAVAGDSTGLALFNDSKHGHAFDRGLLSLTLIRSSYDPDPLPEIGDHSIRCALFAFEGDPDPVDLTRRADAFARPLTVVNTDAHEGSLPPAGGFLRIESDRAVVSCVKEAEPGAGYGARAGYGASALLIVRLYNPTRTDATAVIGAADAGPLGALASCRGVDLMERPVADGEIAVRDGRATVAVPARGIVSVVVELVPGRHQ